MPDLTRESFPRWYGLSWRPEKTALVLSIHKEFLREETRKRITASETVNMFKREFGFARFDPTFKTGFGFDGALAFEKEKNGFLLFLARLPEIRKQSESPCRICSGGGKDRFREEEECFSCRGEGKEAVYDHKPGYALSASLNLLFRAARFIDKKTPAKAPQFFTVYLLTIRGMHGAELGGEYGTEFADWLRRQAAHRNIDAAAGAMMRAHERLVGNDFCDRLAFRASVEDVDGWLNMSCPGNACGLHPDRRGIRPDRGYEFSSQNVDAPHQQLTLLAGLAALHDLADAEFKK